MHEPRNPAPSAAPGPLLELFLRQRAGFLREGPPDLEVRRAALKRLLALLLGNQHALAEAISQDFGQRSAHETRIAEVYTTAAGIRHALRHVKRWMKPRRVAVPSDFWFARARVLHQPKGVVGIISPWNYPVQLALLPLAGALAAGNRVLLKPSEAVPATAELLARLIGGAFPPERVAVVTGGRDVAEAFSRLPLDHLLFTGSTSVGRAVMGAAAENLTPVTLELGGKSPAILGEDAQLERAVPGVMAGKLLNAGQTCIAPDYVLLPEALVSPFMELARQAVARLYPTLAGNPDYTAIASGRHWERLQALLEDARAKGGIVVPLHDEAPANVAAGASGTPQRKLGPFLVLRATDEMRLMQEEIFGPILPLVPYRSLEEAIEYVNARPRPLALYYFGQSAALRDRVLARTTAGGVTVNDTLLHIAVEALPFGGIGASGMGGYHGRQGFETFSHAKSVFLQSRLNFTGLLRPPYTRMTDAVLRWMIGRAPKV